jgi:pSer/pThr/pTyr-binding forkhead associated (FHA) protein
MNYVLQVVRGRSAATTVKLADGVTSLGRGADCWIRVKSAQVSRKHCELHEVGDKLSIRDLGSSNGTWVNGKRVTGQQVLKPGDELTLGGVTFRVAALDAAVPNTPARKAGDTAVVEAVPVADDDEEFEVEFEAEEVTAAEGELIPLADETPKSVVPPSKPKAGPPAAKAPEDKKAAEKPKAKDDKEDEAIAQFLLDLKLEDE